MRKLQCRSERALYHVSYTALHPLKMFVAFADPGDALAALHGAAALGPGARAGAVAVGQGARAGAVAVGHGVRAGVLVPAFGAAVFACAVGSAGSALRLASARLINPHQVMLRYATVRGMVR
jgi:hypothetical protein